MPAMAEHSERLSKEGMSIPEHRWMGRRQEHSHRIRKQYISSIAWSAAVVASSHSAWKVVCSGRRISPIGGGSATRSDAHTVSSVSSRLVGRQADNVQTCAVSVRERASAGVAGVCGVCVPKNHWWRGSMRNEWRWWGFVKAERKTWRKM
ncbi:hypothetical protein BLNAU_21699 [Blattamonas nauphoetae]|uniref:Uncharacterized protein n=1 Tax=Blattamonas nauphoetae TaxID=2049346 RepID=A0ABQ9WW88_9EUKA|nr:hypothetical protein BLNAU_21699 [Blattamonas nauphoetae]